MSQAATIVGHLTPDLDCLSAIWILVRFGGYTEALLRFVPSGSTLNGQPVDADPLVIHVDTGGGRFDHHQPGRTALCAAELVRRAIAPRDHVLADMAEQINRLDHATARAPRDDAARLFDIQALIEGHNLIFPDQPEQVARMMLPNFDAWYASAARQRRLAEAFENRIEFETPWGLGIAVESAEGASSKQAFRKGAILYVYRDQRGWMGIAAQSQSDVDLLPVFEALQSVDGDADWYLHPNRRLLVCGTAKSPPRHVSRLSLQELVHVIQQPRSGRAPHSREMPRSV